MAVLFGFGLGTLILAAAVFYGMVQYRRRNRANDAVTDQATAALFADEDRYARSGENEMREKVRPS